VESICQKTSWRKTTGRVVTAILCNIRNKDSAEGWKKKQLTCSSSSSIDFRLSGPPEADTLGTSRRVRRRAKLRSYSIKVLP
jgi:hypothetical protein